MTSIPRARWLLVFAVVLCGLMISVLLSAALGATKAPAATELLPDIRPEAPSELTVSTDGASGFQLSFDAAFDNLGAGPLRIDGRRPNGSEYMVAYQAVERADGSWGVVPDVGELRYVESEDHEHWHFLQFIRYELVRVTDEELVAPDRKTGFCLGDRYNTDPSVELPGEPPMPGVFDAPPFNNDACSQGDPDRSGLTMGVSVGYGDDYHAFIDGQSIDITHVPEGNYYLVHRVNANVRESDYSNDASSVLLELRWPNSSDDLPTVTVLASCEGSVRCPSE